jgi:ectoine hydroxylase-related dioxygenase (phytanoyl-CoA dioxygenase family)
MDEKQLDYLFDLHGYLILRGAIGKDDLAAMNQWVDDHWDHVEHANLPGNNSGANQWIGSIELHSYGKDDGVNFQNIIEAGPAFERQIDNPAWVSLARKYINPVNGLSIHENFLNVRGQGGHLFIHCGGHAPLCYLTFRQHNTGEWMVGQINVLMALNDIGPGDGPTVLVPGSHKSSEVHPRLEVKGKGVVAINDGQAAGTALGMQEMYLKAGDVLFFTDAVTHGSAERTNPGHRRVMIYRYSPRFIRTRFNYDWSPTLLQRLTPERRQIIQPLEPRRPG